MSCLNFKYKIGDKVCVIGAQKNIDPMINMIGSICTIKDKSGTQKYRTYKLKEDPFGFSWFKEWLAPVKNIEINEEDILGIM